MDDVNLH